MIDIDRLINESWKEFSQSEKQVSKVMASIMGLLKEYYAIGKLRINSEILFILLKKNCLNYMMK